MSDEPTPQSSVKERMYQMDALLEKIAAGARAAIQLGRTPECEAIRYVAERLDHDIGKLRERFDAIFIPLQQFNIPEDELPLVNLIGEGRELGFSIMRDAEGFVVRVPDRGLEERDHEWWKRFNQHAIDSVNQVLIREKWTKAE